MAKGQRYILAIDTATPVSSIALTVGTRKRGNVLASLALGSNVTHSRRLLTAIDWLLAEANVGKSDIEGIAVGLGPGSFTGLRIGMATAKGLAAASDLPLYGVSTLDVIAAGCTSERLICAVLDARKKEVYAACYRCNPQGVAERISDIVACAPDRLAESIDEPVVMIGDGLATYGDLFHTILQDRLLVAPPHTYGPMGGALGLLAGEMRTRGEELAVGAAVPLYVRASDAELNLLKKNTVPNK